MRCRAPQRLILGALIVWAAGVLPAAATTRSVILLFDERLDMPGLAAIDRDLVRTLTSSSIDKIQVYREQMDLSRFGSENYQVLLRDFLRAKYADKKIDVAVAIISPALDFLLRYGDEIFPGAAVIFCGIDRKELGDRLLPPNFRGVLLKREFAPTLELALRLHPDTKHVAVVAGTSEFDVRLLEQAKKEFQVHEGRLSFTYLTTLPLQKLLFEVSKLPPQTVVLFTTLFQDGVGEPFIPHEVVSRIAAAASAPTYGFLDQYLGRGIVGGNLYSSVVHGTEAGSLVLEALADPAPSRPSLLEPSANKVMFDWRQLQRWGISEGQLPAGSEIYFREPTAWERYRWQLTAIFAALLFQAAIIAWLLVERHGRRRAEREARGRMLEVMHLNRSAAAGAMSASFAHELSQPLETIALNADTALRTFEDGPRGAEQLKEALDDIQEANHHALQIMRHMRGLLKCQSGVQLQEFDVSEVIADALRILLPEAKRRDISLNATGIQHRLPVRADPIHLQQVLLNLAINGMDAMADTDATARKITIQAALDGASWIEVSVNDSGKGIAERELSKIFETFYTTKPEGTGLGLSIARNIIESYGGKIWAECRPGGGTSFRFNLPLATTH
jgi:signal transduction histidine kinase